MAHPSQTDLSSLFEHLPIGAYRVTLDGRMLRANRALLALNGYNSEEELLQIYGDAIPDPYLDPARRNDFRGLLMRDGRVVNFESEMVSYRSGARFWAREHAHLVRDSEGNVLFYEGTVEDITEERQAKERMRKNEAMLQNLLQTIPDQVWLKDIQGIYMTCNDNFAHTLGMERANIVGTRDIDLVGAELAEEFLESDRRAMRAGKPVCQ